MRSARFRRLGAAAVLATALGLAGTQVGRASDQTVRLLFFDRNGGPLSAGQARALMSNGSAGAAADALVDPQTLQDLRAHPLREARGGLSFTLPHPGAALAVNWPTTRGYSTVVLDHGGRGFAGGGTFNFTYEAARDARRRLDAAVLERHDYRPSRTFRAAYRSAVAHLDRATASGSQSRRGAEGQRALDDLDAATGRLLAEYGVAFAHAHQAGGRPWLGLTLDSTDAFDARLSLARELTAPYGWVRIVFDPGTHPQDYRAAVAAAKARHLRVLGLPVDSSAAHLYTRQGYLARVKEFVDALPRVDAWEVGNEVNGSSVGPGIAAKVADAAAYVRRTRPSAQVVLTLYWQIGTDRPQLSTFNWARENLSAATRHQLDVVLLSTYVADAPMGLAFDQVMRALHGEFPAQEVGLGELGYWEPGTPRAWWAFSRQDPTGAGRRSVATQYYRAALGYDFSVGGGFWWYFRQEMPSDTRLASTVRDIRRDVLAGPTDLRR